MTQGDFSSLSWKHALVAYNTGVKAAVTYALCCLLLRRISVLGSVALTGVLTAIADIATHPTHFGAPWAEAAATGLGASLLALGFHLIFESRINRKK